MSADAALVTRLSKAKLLVFDFDGTLVDSNSIKIKAFDTCFDKESDFVEIQKYCHSHNHTPRGDKFRHVVEKILMKTYTREIEQKLHAQYESATTQAVIAASEISGAEEFLQKVGRKWAVALLSSTPHEILGRIMAARKWTGYFGQLQGAPIDKAAWLKTKEQVIFFGDSPEDQGAAQTAGVPFVGVNNLKLKSNSDFYLENYSTIKDLI